MRLKKEAAWVMCIAVFLLSACAHMPAGQEKNGTVEAVSMESAPIIEDTLPQLTPDILIDQNGYSVEGVRKAAVKGSRLPDNFCLVNAEKEETVYRGKIQNIIYHGELGLYSGEMIFEDYNVPGKYYLECEYVGRSYPFYIEEGQRQGLFGELLEELLERCGSNQISLEEMAELLTVCEWYPRLAGREDAAEAPEILQAAAEWTGALMEQEPPREQTALYAAVFAKFSYLYQHYDSVYAAKCLKWAAAAFDQTDNTLEGDAEYFRALTELYRATGRRAYSDQITGYRSYFEDNSSYLGQQDYLYGVMTYLMTRQRVDVDLCTLLMDHLMSCGEELAGNYEELLHPVLAGKNGMEELLEQVSILTGVNYVLNSYQYTLIEEEVLIYLGGRNPQSVCFYQEEESRTGYICLLAQLAAAEREAAERRMEEKE